MECTQSDRIPDAVAGKHRASWKVTPWTSFAILVFLPLAGTITLSILGGVNQSLPLAIIGFLLALFYSCPPLRFKNRSILGPIVAAFSQWVFPFLAISLSSQLDHSAILPVCILSLALFIVGIRWILIHQIRDFSADKFSHVMTLVTRVGRPKIEFFVSNFVFPFELFIWSLCYISLSVGKRQIILIFIMFTICVVLSFRQYRNKIAIDNIWKRPMAAFYFVYYPLSSALLIIEQSRSTIIILAIIIIFAFCQSSNLMNLYQIQNNSTE